MITRRTTHHTRHFNASYALGLASPGQPQAQTLTPRFQCASIVYIRMHVEQSNRKLNYSEEHNVESPLDRGLGVEKP